MDHSFCKKVIYVWKTCGERMNRVPGVYDGGLGHG